MVQLPPELPSEEEPDHQWLVIVPIVGGLLLITLALVFLVSPRVSGDREAQTGQSERSAVDGSTDAQAGDSTSPSHGSEESDSGKEDAHKEDRSDGQGSHSEEEPSPTPNTSEEQRNGPVDAEENDNSGSKESPSPGTGTSEEDEAKPKQVNTFRTFENRGASGGAGKNSKSGAAGQSADFFGVTAEGKNFVYVIDKSSSMTGGKFIAARDELVHSIDQLTGGQKVCIVFFDASFYVQPDGSLVNASKKNLLKIKEWIDKARPGGSTDPFPAVEHALSMNPDALFVLSDGEFTPGVVDRIKQVNRDFTIPIHTIAFTTRANTLRDISAQNRGTYRYVP